MGTHVSFLNYSTLNQRHHVTDESFADGSSLGLGRVGSYLQTPVVRQEIRRLDVQDSNQHHLGEAVDQVVHRQVSRTSRTMYKWKSGRVVEM